MKVDWEQTGKGAYLQVVAYVHLQHESELFKHRLGARVSYRFGGRGMPSSSNQAEYRERGMAGTAFSLVGTTLGAFSTSMQRKFTLQQGEVIREAGELCRQTASRVFMELLADGADEEKPRR